MVTGIKQILFVIYTIKMVLSFIFIIFGNKIAQEECLEITEY